MQIKFSKKQAYNSCDLINFIYICNEKVLLNPKKQFDQINISL